jgi:protein-tyrosine phosphatase
MIEENASWLSDSARFISFDDGRRRIFGGSFFDAPSSPYVLKINLMAEAPLPCDIYIPIRDYSVPSSPAAFVEAFETIRNGDEDVYVGCYGGMGRTGLFMSCFLKYIGEPNPLETVRLDYNPHAVETQSQVEFLEAFPVAPSPSYTRSPRPR